MLQRSVCRRFFGGFSSGFSKGFSGGGFPLGSGNGGGGGGLGGLFNGGPLGGFFNKALEWCSTAHAQSIAREQGIDLRDIRFEATADGGMNVLVDAPNATPLQIEQLGKRVQEECPVARFRKTRVNTPQQQMKWLRLPDKNGR